MFRSTGSYEPDPYGNAMKADCDMFRSTGSYEPDPAGRRGLGGI